VSTWAIPFTRRRLTALIEILRAGPVPAQDAAERLADYVGDDELFEVFNALRELGEGSTDVRSSIVAFLDRILLAIDEEQMTPVLLAPRLARIADNQMPADTPMRAGQFIEDGLVERLRKALPKLRALQKPALDESDIRRRLSAMRSGALGLTFR